MSNIKASPAEAAPTIVISQSETDAMRDAGGRSIVGVTDAADLLKGFGAACLATRDSDLTTMLRVLFYEGAIRDGCGVDLEEAKRILALSSSKHKTAKEGDKRTEDQDRVYGLAKYNWSIACDAVGLPKSGTGGNRGSGSSTPNRPAAGLDIKDFHAPHGLDTEGVINLFAKFQDAMRRVISENAAKITGDAGSALRQCVDDVAEYIKDAHDKLAADKPVLSEVEALKAELAALKAKKSAKLAKAA
jgi:hypothetical protein